MRLSILLIAAAVALSTTTTTFAFTIPTTKKTFQTHKLHSSSLEQDQETQSTATAVRAPLKYIGPYPTLPLHFPTLSTSSQRTRNETGISLDFILDTAANTNTINAQVASELQLPKVGKALKGVGAAGVIEGDADMFLLGDCELDGLKKEEERFIFMTGLTASALPVASPAATAGLLSLAFLNCFEGGVEFNWGTTSSSGGGTTTSPDGGVRAAIPSVTFYSDNNKFAEHALLEGMQSTKIKPLEGTGLPIITLHINGIAIPALLDTGSPVTVVNEEAAALAGIQWEKKEEKESNMNPFARIAKNWKMAQAAARGDVLLVAGGNGERVELVKSEQPVRVTLGDGDDDESIDFGQNHVYVGNLPGLAALENYFGDEKNENKSAVPPAAMLGMDIIRTKPRMFYRADEVFF